MVVIVPIDADVDEAQDVTENDRPVAEQRVPARVVRRLEFQHHDRDDHGDHPVGESFESPLFHPAPHNAPPRPQHEAAKSYLAGVEPRA
jgi:hypothetical protein